MTDSTFLLAQHVDQISRLTQAGHLHQAKAYVAQLDLATQQALDGWLAYTLTQSVQHTSCLPKVLHECLLGWQAYYKHQYLTAHQHFSTAILEDDWQQLTPNVALGLCKVYTRTGHWHSAREWALYYLSQARQQLHHFDVAKGYGALAEIFLRAGYAQQALACFQMSSHLMPVGHGQHARQLNFMASALIRNAEYGRAEDLLHESRQISRQQLKEDQPNSEAYLGFLHSTMRFCWLHMLRSGKYKHVLADEFARFSLRGSGCKKTGAEAMPFGMMRLAYGASSLVLGYTSFGQQQLQVAQDIFSENMLMEYQWAFRLLHPHAEAEQSPVYNELEKIFTLHVLHPPAFDVVVDYTWHTAKLNNQGFAPLMEKYDNITEVIDLWHLFFI